MLNLNIVASKPVFIEIERKAAEHDGQRDQHPLFPRHKLEGLTLGRGGIFEREGDALGSRRCARLRGVAGIEGSSNLS